MKNQTRNFLCSFLLIGIIAAGVQAAAISKLETLTVKTSAICESCKARIEKALKNVDGVQAAILNLNNKKIKIKYDASKTNPDQLRLAIANSGYDADDVKRNEEAFKHLPMCCQNPEKEDMH